MRASNRLPKLSRHKGTGQGIVAFAGRTVYLGVWPSGMKTAPEDVQQRYRAAIAEWLAGGHQAPARRATTTTTTTAAGSSVLTIDELFAAFWTQHAQKKFVGPDGKPTPELSSHRVCLKIVRRMYGSLPVASFGPLKLRAVRQAFIDEKWARVNVNHHIARLKRVFKWGVSVELVDPSILLGLGSVPGLRRGGGECREGRKVRPVADDAVDATLPHMPGPVASMVQFLRFTGARVGEACVMRLADIDRSGQTWLFKPTSHKTMNLGHTRTVAIGPKARELLVPLIEGLAPGDAVFSPERWVLQQQAERTAKRRTPRWPSHLERNKRIRKPSPAKKPGKFYDRHSISTAIRRACEKAFPIPTGATKEEAKKWRAENFWFVHQLRHSFATTARRTAGIEATSAALGHAGLAVTQVYAERDELLASQLAERIG